MSEKSAFEASMEALSNFQPGKDNAQFLTLTDKCGKIRNWLAKEGITQKDSRTTLCDIPSTSLSEEALFNNIKSNNFGNLKQLLLDCGITEDNPNFKTSLAGAVIAINRARGGIASYEEYNRVIERPTSQDGVTIQLDSLYGNDAWGHFTNGATRFSQEAFGATQDMVPTDMNVMVSVAIMNPHVRLIPRLIPTRETVQPCAHYVREELFRFDLADPRGSRVPMVKLYKNPSYVANELKRIIPLVANDANNDWLVSDGVLKFSTQTPADILNLSIRSDKPGYGAINYTDLIAENAKLESVQIQLTSGQTTENFTLQIPAENGRLFHAPDNDSHIRYGMITTSIGLNADTKTTAGAQSQILKDLPVDESIVIESQISVQLDTRGPVSAAVMRLQAVAHHKSDDNLLSNDAGAAKAIVTALGATGVTALGYTLDARFSEENLRKTSLGITTSRRQYEYNIPYGPNFFIDYAIGQKNADENAANLMRVIGIGIDHVGLNLLKDGIDSINDRLLTEGNNHNLVNTVGTDFVSGGKIIPAVAVKNLDFRNAVFIRDADRSGDIKGKTSTFLNALLGNLVADSLYVQAIGGGTTPTFKCVTTMNVLSNVISQPQIHQHMTKEDGRANGDGVEYVLGLPNGIRIEFVTTTFEDMADTAILWPVIKNNAESELHFAHNWSYGSLVAHYTPSGEAAHHRLFANVRELPIITTPIAARISILGMNEINGQANNPVFYPTINTVVTGAITTTAATAAAGEGTGTGTGTNGAGAGAGQTTGGGTNLDPGTP